MMDKRSEVLAQKHHEESPDTIREECGKKAFQRWKNPLCRGVMADADGEAILRGSCGVQMQIYLKFEGSRVTLASFQTDG